MFKIPVPIRCFSFAAALAALLLAGCPKNDDKPAPAEDPVASLLWSVSTLSEQIAANNVVILDCRQMVWAADGTYYWPYDTEHITGSYNFDMFLFGDPYPVNPSTTYIPRLNELGITPTTRICLYDAGVANPQGKVFFQLERIGCTDVHILDGGFTVWKNAGGATSTTATTLPATPSNFVEAVDNTCYWQLTDMKTCYDLVAGGNTTYALIDYREAPLYYGHHICPDAARHGRMPNCTLLDWHDYFDTSTSLFKSKADIQTLTVAAGGDPSKVNVVICNKGWRTGIAYFALRHIGWPKANIRHYVGGIREWAAQDPVAYPMTTEGCYTRETSMPTSAGGAATGATRRYAGASAVVGSTVYCIGGFTANSGGSVINGQNQAFDISTGTWTNKASMPVSLAFTAAAAVGNYIYVFGGIDGPASTSTISGAVYRYDTIGDSWTTETAVMATPRYSFAAAAVGNVIYMGGGLTNTNTADDASYSDDFLGYDTTGGTWVTTLPDLPGTGATVHGRRCHAMAANGNDVYLIGGYWYDDSQTGDACKKDLSDLNVIDVSAGTPAWVALPAMPGPMAGHAATYANSKIYVLGGWAVAGSNSNVYEFTPGTPGAWEQKMKNTRSAAIGWPRFWYFIGSSGTDIAVIGGYNGGPGAIQLTPNHGMKYFNQVYQYDLTSIFD